MAPFYPPLVQVVDGKHIVAACRLVFNFACGHRLFGGDEWKAAAEHGLTHLKRHFRQPHGGFAWLLSSSTSFGRRNILKRKL